MGSFHRSHIILQAADKSIQAAESVYTFIPMQEVSASSTALTVVKRKGRASKQYAEAYCFVLSFSITIQIQNCEYKVRLCENAVERQQYCIIGNLPTKFVGAFLSVPVNCSLTVC